MTEGDGGEGGGGGRVALVGGAGGAVLTALLRSARFSVVEGGEHWDATWGAGRPVVFALWHGRLLPCSFYHRHRRLATLISQHRDGDYIARVVEGWGFHAVRGSSSRGGTAALRQMVRLLRGGTALAVTPDGPRGPRQRMKPGPVLAAQLAGVPIVPVTAGASRGWWFGGWDRFLVPQPFSRVLVAYGEPLVVPADSDAEAVEGITREVERRLDDLTARVDAATGNPPHA